MNDFTTEEAKKIINAKDIIKFEIMTFTMTIQKLSLSKSFFVSGGCIGSLLRGESVNDYDVYFFNRSEGEQIVKLYSEDPSYKNEVAIYDEKYRDVGGPSGMLITENAVTLKNKIQLITKHYGTPSEIRSTFDFMHCLPYYDSRDDKLYISREQYDLNVNKKLKINNKYSQTTHRENKFLKRGWTWL